MKKIKVNFVDFWPGFNATDNYFYNLLKKNFCVEISDKPDYLFFSVFGSENNLYSCIKIYFSGENIGPDFNKCDYSMCYDFLEDTRHLRLPLYILYDGYYNLINKNVSESLFNRKFCNFVYSNINCQTRNSFFQKLSSYKKVDSGGRCLNNIGYFVADKLFFQSNYKFSISFENEAYRTNRDGYTTEKIMQPMLVNSIPIYWGNTLIFKDFNTKSFINYHDFKSEDDVIEHIILLDNNEEEYMNTLSEPWLNGNAVPEDLKEENIVKFLYKIFN